ncbi:hypothetical protein [Bacillus thuringiensis]|uniref:hypothetical protein n=1 Tax=Bacillus thuringiensis TaxID=1428 RepID=UPI000BFC6A95|nr:hypothetical protein [Bacillus thuringiensis]PGT89915.1 hypothetical protein COD17_09195 [Bacillus thuringiensis]
MHTFSLSAKRTIKRLEKTGMGLVNLPSDLNLLLHGAKPSVLMRLDTVYARCFLENYPSLTVPRAKDSGVLIFLNAEELQKYVTRVATLQPSMRTGENMLTCSAEKIGVVLGYPPEVCEWYEDMQQTELCKRNDGKCTVHYHGYRFFTHREVVLTNIKWMEENRPIPQEIQKGVYIEIATELDEQGHVIDRKTVTLEEFREIGKEYIEM